MSILTPERLESIAALADAATPGPWDGEYKYGIRTSTGEGLVSWDYGWHHENENNDKPFIAAARTAVPELLAHAKAMDEKFTTAQARILELERVIIDARICLTAQNYAGAEGKLDEAKI